MSRFTVLSLIIALIAGYFGFETVSGYSWEIAKVLFYLFLAVAVLSFLGSAIAKTAR